MNIPLLKKQQFLIIASFFLLLSGLYYVLFEKDAPGAFEERYTAVIQKHITDEISLSKNELTEAGIKYQSAKDTLFANFEIKAQYPFYIFRNGHLVYWSDYHYIPDYHSISRKGDTHLLTTENGKYIVSRLQFNHQQSHIEIFSLINLYQRFRNENDYLKTGYNPEVFSHDPLGISTAQQLTKNAYQNIFDERHNFLFSVMPSNADTRSEIPKKTLLLLGIALFFLGAYALSLMLQFKKNYRYEKMFFVLVAYLFFLRFVMIYNNIPAIFFDTDLFNAKFYYANFVAPSLGDLLLNILACVLLLPFLVIYGYRSNAYFLLSNTASNTKNVSSVLCIIISFGLTFFCYHCLMNIYEKSQFFLDLSYGIVFSKFKIITLFVFFLLSTIYFFGLHLFVGLFIRLNNNLKIGLARWVYGFFLGLFLAMFFDAFRWIYILTGFYFLLGYLAQFPKFIYNFRYKTSIYYFTGALTFTLLTLYVVHCQEQKKEVLAKQKFGVGYLSENDLMAEKLLSRAVQTISQDSAIQKAMLSPNLAAEKTQPLVKNKLDLYFDKYDTQVLMFDKSGTSLDNSEGIKDFNFQKTSYQKAKYRTQNPDVFFVNDVDNNFNKQYVTFIPLKNKEGSIMGEIVLDLKLRDEFSGSIYPDFLMDKKLVHDPEVRNYNYAIYDANNKLVYKTGSYNYELKFPVNLLTDNDLYKGGQTLNNYFHIGVKGDNGRKIVVSTKSFPYRDYFANFSYLFMVLLLGIILMLIFYVLRSSFLKTNVNYATKIQLYLNIAFLLPLFLVVVIMLSVINITFQNNQEKTYLDNAKNIASTLQLHLESFRNKRMTRPFLEQAINGLARETKVEINYYDKNGKLDLTTRPLIFDYGLQSNLINPEVYRRVIQENENEIMLPESLGNLSYKTVYSGIKDENNDLMGVVAVPFYDTKFMLDQQITDIVASILGIFAVIFLVLLATSYFASNILTNPLRMVTQRLKGTNLDKLNEPLDWHSNDEIGLLMGEYNKMLQKLQDSKVALSQSEKQSAWREMAKQVAHEIKNPLTPMKLSIQQLQRTLPNDNPQNKERINRTLNSLTEQIDNISNIANSFSEFAKMPIPRNENFDLVPVLQKTTDLYSEDENILLHLSIQEKDAYVIGDRQFMSRVITNLILNGIQSVPADRKPIIHLSLYKSIEKNFAVIEVRDNGQGIPEDIRQRIFIPNFSTKTGGSGLGLAMVRRGIEHAGGSIWFETTEGEGTTFFVELPLA